MKNIKVVALSVIVVTLGAYTFLMPFNDEAAEKTTATQSEVTQQVKAPMRDNTIKVAKQSLPVEHGIADEKGRQIGVAPQRLRAAPPPPTAATQDSRYRKSAHQNANEHGKERNHTAHSKNTANSPPPPTGANRG